MTKEEFERQYIKRSNIPKETYDKYFVTLSCNCKDKICNGWVCVLNDDFAIKTHNELYGKGEHHV